MTEFEFCEKITHAIPETKDIERAEAICLKASATEFNRNMGKLQRTVLADKQLKAITDDDKFFRRIKAFLDNAIPVNLASTKYSVFRNKEFVKDYIVDSVHIAENNIELEALLASL